MFFENQARDNQPITRYNGVPVYLTTIVVAVIVVGLIVSALSETAFALFAFIPELFWRHGQVWRLASYLAADQVHFFTIFNLLFLYTFGRDCEVEMGRGRYSAYLGLLIFTPTLVATVFWLCGFGGAVTGSIPLSMGLVIGFATIYPNVSWWAGIPMRFVAIGCVFLSAVGHLSRNDQLGLVNTLATCAVSFGYIRGMRAGLFSGFSWATLFRRKPKLRLLPPLDAPRNSRRGQSMSGDVDDVLDKIAKSGLRSLTAKEKARLEAAREALLKKDRR
jgi:membrane associated rhomboid family serine protease